MTGPDRLQPGIFFRSGQTSPPCFRLQLMNIANGTSPGAAADAVELVLAGARGDESGADADSAMHSPPLTSYDRPAFLAYLDQGTRAFPSIPWTRSPPANAGEADLAVQLTAPHPAGAACAAVRMWQRIVQDDLPLDPVASFEGFGRPDGRGWLGFHDGGVLVCRS